MQVQSLKETILFIICAGSKHARNPERRTRSASFSAQNFPARSCRNHPSKRSEHGREGGKSSERVVGTRSRGGGGLVDYHGVMPGGGVPGVVGGRAPAEEVPGDEPRGPAAAGSPRHEPHRLGRHLFSLLPTAAACGGGNGRGLSTDPALADSSSCCRAPSPRRRSTQQQETREGVAVSRGGKGRE